MPIDGIKPGGEGMTDFKIKADPIKITARTSKPPPPNSGCGEAAALVFIVVLLWLITGLAMFAVWGALS
jgi:hypothetical protein